MRKLYCIPLFITLLISPTLLHANEKESVPYSFNYNEPFSLDNTIITGGITSGMMGLEGMIGEVGVELKGHHRIDNIGHLGIDLYRSILLGSTHEQGAHSLRPELNSRYSGHPIKDITSSYRINLGGEFYLMEWTKPRIHNEVVHTEYGYNRTTHYYVEIDNVERTRLLALRGGMQIERYLLRSSDITYQAIPLDNNHNEIEISSSDMVAAVTNFNFRGGLGITTFESFEAEISGFGTKTNGIKRHYYFDFIGAASSRIHDVTIATPVEGSDFYDQDLHIANYNLDDETLKDHLGIVFGLDYSRLVGGTYYGNIGLEVGTKPGPENNSFFIRLHLGMGGGFLWNLFT